MGYGIFAVGLLPEFLQRSTASTSRERQSSSRNIPSSFTSTPLAKHREGRTVFTKDAAVLQGTIELLVLKRLSRGSMHGYGIASWIETATDDVLRVEEGSLYPALYRMVQKRWIKGEWGISENNRRAKFYRLTKAGEREFEEQSSGWLRLSSAVSRAVTSTELPATGGNR